MSQATHQPDDTPSQEALNEQETLAPTLWRQREPGKGLPVLLLDLIAARFLFLGEPLRLKVSAIVASGEQGGGEVAALTGVGQSNVSTPLATLAEVCLVRRRKVGSLPVRHGWSVSVEPV